METPNAATLGEHSVRLGLVTPEQLREAWDELGERNGDAEPLLLVLERKCYLTPWQSQRLLKGERDGYFLGGYRLLYKIASGSFGRVYRADDPRTGTVVAIKVLRRKWSDIPRSVELFEREGKVGMSLRHANIVEILAVNRDAVSGQYYIVMEFVEGGNLRDFLGIRKKLAPHEAVRLLEDATAGLAYACSRGISHRDMKPTNILIASQGTAKLVDFGLAEVYQSAQKHDAAQVDRTVDYAGLERATGAPFGDVRSDIYFLGCVFYEMLTGRPPLEMTRDKRARMRKQRFFEVKPLDRTEAPGPVARLLETMMALNPQQRFQTPSQLLEAVRDTRRDLEGKSEAAGKPSARTLFVVESDARLQETLRDKFKELGYRVLLAVDPVRALDRYRQQPYDALIVDAGTTGKDGMLLFEKVMAEAKRHDQFCAGILVLSEDQSGWRDQVVASDSAAVMVRPVGIKQLHRKLEELFGAKGG
jgi:serine/threonine protein kinase